MQPVSFKRTFKLGKLYYKFIKGTPLELQGWTSAKLATFLESQGFIRLVTVQGIDSKGRFTQGIKKYIECEGKSISRQQFFKLFGKTLRAGAIGEEKSCLNSKI